MAENGTHTPLDALLGASPRPVVRHWLSLLLLALAGMGTLIFFVRFVAGDDSPYYSAPIERGDITALVSERGVVRSTGEVTIRATLDGKVIWLLDANGGQIRQGDVLARLDAGEIRRLIAIDRSELATAETALQGAQVSEQDAIARLARFEAVWRRSGGRVPSLNEMETARTDARRTSLAVEASQSAMDAARLKLRDDEAKVARAEIRAPIDGIVVARQAQPGQSVMERQPLLTLAPGLSSLTVEVPLSNAPTDALAPGTPARVRLDAMPDKVLPGTLSRLWTGTPPDTAQSHAVFTLQQPAPQIRLGMTATVEIDLPERRNVLLVPDAALTFEPGAPNTAGRKRKRIYLLSKDGEPKRVYVMVGGSDGQRTEVFATGIQPGDQVITGWRDASTAETGQKQDRKH